LTGKRASALTVAANPDAEANAVWRSLVPHRQMGWNRLDMIASFGRIPLIAAWCFSLIAVVKAA